MTPQHIDIPALISPLAIVTIILWLCLTLGIIFLSGAVSVAGGSRGDGPGARLRIGFLLIGIYVVGYWLLYQVIPFYNTASHAVTGH